jgi:peptidyl-prolyl cis-trans isomerase B (cyclophilin B)
MYLRTCLKLSICIAFLAAGVFINGCEEEKNINNQKKTGEIMTDQKPQETPKNSNLVKLQTSKGDIVIELNEEKAPITVKNFVDYVKDGYYDGLVFHRVIKGFMIQGGGFDVDMKQKGTKSPITNEGDNGLRNQRGTIAMARTNDPDSATSQFYICDNDNDFLNYAPGKPGYAVFGKVVEGMDTVDAIAAVKTGIKAGMQDVPVDSVIITSAKMVAE